MKNSLSLLSLVTFAACGGAAELRIATIDLQRVLTEYDRAQAVAQELREKEVSFVRELEGLRLEGRRLLDEAEKVRRLSLDNTLSASAREEQKKTYELKLTDLHAFQVRYDQTRTERDTELRAYAARVNRSVVDEIVSATQQVGSDLGYHLVLNFNKANPASSDVLLAKNVDDVTAKVLAVLKQSQAKPPARVEGKETAR